VGKTDQGQSTHESSKPIPHFEQKPVPPEDFAGHFEESPLYLEDNLEKPHEFLEFGFMPTHAE